MNKTVIFPHIPKCGGTTLQKQLANLKGNVMMDYDYPPSEADWHKRRCEQRNREYGLLDFSPFDLIFGHFPISRYQSEKYHYVRLVRDPMDRLFSQYRYLMDRAGRGVSINANATLMAERLRKGEASFYQWAVGSGLTRLYIHYVDYWPKERFTLIGDTSDYGAFAAKLGDLLDIEIDESIRERAGVAMEIPLDAKEDRMLRKALSEEYAWYESFVVDAV